MGDPAVGQSPGEAGPPEQGLRRAAAGTAGGRGGALAVKADAGCAWGGAVRWLGGRRGRLPNLGFWERFKPGSSKVEGIKGAGKAAAEKGAAWQLCCVKRV